MNKNLISEKIKVGIVGGAGYTGGELLRLLLHHPKVVIQFIHSRSYAGKYVSEIHNDLIGDTNLCFTVIDKNVDVVFLCLGHGESKNFIKENPFSSETKIIDLSQDHRINADHFTYGLPELQREKIKIANKIANPGCFATAIQLALLPLVKNGMLSEVFCTGITGSTGAGQKLQETTAFNWRSNNISAYKTLTHQHLLEIMQTIKLVNPVYNNAVNFIPWRGNFTRGIFISACVTTNQSQQELQNLFQDYYETHPFTHVSPKAIDLKQVINTNKCLLQIEKGGDKAVIHSAIDNLLKGAVGQAIQNMNLIFGFEETCGLNLKASAF